MPSTPRDSSILSQGGLRRAAARQREHLPFRNDERVQGKRTGLTAVYMEPDSDGFEPFSGVLAQLDQVPVPTVRGKAKATPRRSSAASGRKSLREPSIAESEEDGYDEYDVTMDADPSPPPPRGQISIPGTPSASIRIGPPTRRKSAPRVSDFDRIPSPGRGAPPRAKPRARPPSDYDDEEVPIASSGGRPRPRSSSGRRTTPFAREEDEGDDLMDSPGVNRRSHPRPSRVSLAHELERRGSVGARVRPSDVATPRPSYASGDFGVADTSVGAASFGALSDGMDMDDEELGEAVEFPEEFHADYPPEFAHSREPSVQASAKAKAKKKDKGKARAVTPPQEEEEDQDTTVMQEDMDVPMLDDDYPSVEYPPNPADDPEPADELPEPEDEPMEPADDEQPADVEDEEEAPQPKSKSKAKQAKGKEKEKISKRKATEPDDENEEPSVGKKTTTKKPRSRSNKETTPAYPQRLMSEEINQRMSEDEGSSADERGLRRGKRKRYRPLEWWRLEKVEYGRGKALAEIKRIITLPKEPVQPLGARKRGATVGKRTKSKAPESSSGRKKSAAADPEFNPEEGWDLATEPEGVVQDFVTKAEHRRRVVWPARLVNTRPAENNSFGFQKIFGDGDFIAAGQLVIPPGKSKPSKNSRDNSYVFYIIEGAVKFTVHNTAYVVCQGGMIIVPRGNAYSIHNISDRPVRVFFAQARKIRVDEDEDPPVVVSRRSRTSGASEASSGGESNGRRGSTVRV